VYRDEPQTSTGNFHRDLVMRAPIVAVCIVHIVSIEAVKDAVEKDDMQHLRCQRCTFRMSSVREWLQLSAFTDENEMLTQFQHGPEEVFEAQLAEVDGDTGPPIVSLLLLKPIDGELFATRVIRIEESAPVLEGSI